MNSMNSIQDFLATLMLVPDDIILALATREFDLTDAHRCVCGWAAREALARECGIAAEDVSDNDRYNASPDNWSPTLGICHSRFGGTYGEWERVFDGAMAHTQNVEQAFVLRLDAVSRCARREAV